MKNNKVESVSLRYNEDGKLIVDSVWRDSHYPNNYIVIISDSAFLLSADRYYPDGQHAAQDLHYLKYYRFNPKNECMARLQQYAYIYTGCVPKEGFHVYIGRAITDEELNHLITDYHLTSEDISERFEATTGEIYGKYAKTYTSIQVAIDNGKVIELEQKLRKLGIEAANIAPGRVNIRIE